MTKSVDKKLSSELSSLMDRLLSTDNYLTGPGNWLLTQLRIAEYWGQKPQQEALSEERPPVPKEDVTKDPEKWRMTQGLNLWPWQNECAEKWLQEDMRGIAKVVTGAGKTVFALHLMERLQNEVDQNLRVAIIVPTIVLMYQWVDMFRERSNLPAKTVGLLGGGRKDDFDSGRKVLVCVLNSAAKLLSRLVHKAEVGDHLLLVVDECHRATGPTMSNVFRTARRYNLGLSATPESDVVVQALPREAQDNTDFQHDRGPSAEDVLASELGRIIYELRVDEAVKQGILSTFEIRHFGLPLEPKEKDQYEKHTREIRDLERTLQGVRSRSKRDLQQSLFQFAQRVARKPDSPAHAEAERYIQEVRRRKRLLYRAQSRIQAALELIRQTFETNPNAKVLLFHESISEVMRLYFQLLRAGFKVAVDHSELPDSLRAVSIALFRSREAQVLVSARTLIEGFDVPAADVGIIAASSTSIRQRVQTIGRMLRRPEDEAKTKHAIISVLYMAGTSDETIYAKLDWGQQVGAQSNVYFTWRPPPVTAIAQERAREAYQPVQEVGPPRQPKPTETEMDWEGLKPGDPYPGRYEGEEYKCVDQGNILGPGEQIVRNPQGIGEQVRTICPGSARFRVTPLKKAILCWDRRQRVGRFVGFLRNNFQFQDVTTTQDNSYTLKHVRGQTRIQNSDGRYALLPGQAADPEKGEDAIRIVEAVDALKKEIGRPISGFILSTSNEAYCVLEGKRYELCELKKGLEFR